ncbi:hypothetical protein CHS0354_010704 [Potamilus streckersoni]|uniref:VWFA domain-containing protein n=1 Tax=Potamilus streckersoni TaxID=2493646 RepID=A0AAE0TC41_9BIVA|nr:hypothetical protein CHS0354_010704 [Potamilus streckersoni]
MLSQILLSLFLLSLQAQPTENASPIIVFRLIRFVAERLPLIFQYTKIIDNVINPTDNVDTQIRAVLEILQKEQHQIKIILIDLQASVDLYQYIAQIANAQTDISSVNEDYVELQKASNERDRDYMSNNFVENYKSHSVDTHIRNLRDRARGIPILSLEAMPVLLSRKLKCNMTAIRLFQKGYLSLMMNGYGLKDIFINITGGDAESQVNDWIVYMNLSVTGLLTTDQTCMNNYREYAIQDFEGIDSVQMLHKTVQEKYTWLEAFIVSYSKRGFQYNAIYASYLKIKNVFETESKTKVMVFCEKKGNGSAYDETKSKILQEISKYQNARTDEGDNEAAKHILNSILETTSSVGSNPYAIIIFADSSDFPVKDIVTGYCVNEVSFEIIYGTVKENSFWLWEQRTYHNVKYHVHIFLPTEVIDQPINDFNSNTSPNPYPNSNSSPNPDPNPNPNSNPNNSYKKDVSASFKAKACMPLLIVLDVFVLLYFRTW